MTKSIKLSAITAMAVVSIIGCGGGSSSSDVKTGTGYYVDNAVEGVDYICGSKKGKTDSKGTFTFEEGKECKFTLAGIPLRTTKADELEDGKEVFEDNPKVAKFLQSIDANNDLSDGIQITDEVLTALTTALETSNSVAKLPEGTVLTEVVASVGHDIKEVSGDVRTDEQVQEHLAQTQTEITKSLLAGKTFYAYYEEDGKQYISEVEVNNLATSWDYKTIVGGTNTGTEAITIEGQKLSIKHASEDELDVYTVVKRDKYIAIVKKDKYEFKFFHLKADAQAYFDSVKGSSSAPATSTLSDLIVGKTYYVTSEDSYTDENGNIVNNDHVETLVFGTDGKLYDTWVQNGEQKEVVMDYSINGDTLSIVAPNDGTVTFTNVEELGTHIRFTDASGKESGRFFFTYADANTALNNN